MLLGRSGDIRVDEEHVAHRHLRFEKAPDGCRIVPLENKNGVYIRLLKKTVIESGDIVFLGSEVLLFERVEEAERDAPPLHHHGITLLGSPARRAWGRLTQLTCNGTLGDIRHLFTPEVVIGRESGDWLFPDDDCMSRRHAAIAYDEQDVTVTDLGSANGTYLRLREPRVVPVGTLIRLGSRVFRLE